MAWNIIRSLLDFELPGFRAEEILILDAVERALPQEARTRFHDWKQSLNYIRRNRHGCEINLYCMEGGSAVRREQWRIQGLEGHREIVLATVSCESVPGVIHTVLLWAVEGIPSALESESEIFRVGIRSVSKVVLNESLSIKLE